MLPDLIAFTTSVVFLTLALWHFRMAFSTSTGESAAVPSVDGKPLFMPSRTSTVAVGIVLILFAALVAATAQLLATGLSQNLLAGLSYALALGLLARAIGDFKYLGFFKRVRGSRFATMDTRVYSPLCTLLAAAVALNAVLHHAT